MKCDHCVHKDVCLYTSQFKDLLCKARILEVPNMFSIVLDCKYFKNYCLYYFSNTNTTTNEPSNSSPYIPDSGFTYVNAVSAESKSTLATEVHNQ